LQQLRTNSSGRPIRI